MLVVLLGSYVSIRRLFMGPRARLGQPVPDELAFAVRAHGNAAEWVPLGIVALLMLELAGAPSQWLHWCGGTLVVLRLLHATYALNKGPFWVAVPVAVLHYTLVGGMGLWAVVLRLR